MDLDGKNRKVIWQLNENETFDISAIVVGDNKIYIPVEKKKYMRLQVILQWM